MFKTVHYLPLLHRSILQIQTIWQQSLALCELFHQRTVRPVVSSTAGHLIIAFVLIGTVLSWWCSHLLLGVDTAVTQFSSSIAFPTKPMVRFCDPMPSSSPVRVHAFFCVRTSYTTWESVSSVWKGRFHFTLTARVCSRNGTDYGWNDQM
jgi:hypothetical protein